jgi:hypothetical protein
MSFISAAPAAPVPAPDGQPSCTAGRRNCCIKRSTHPNWSPGPPRSRAADLGYPVCHSSPRACGACFAALGHGEDALRLNATVPPVQRVGNYPRPIRIDGISEHPRRDEKAAPPFPSMSDDCCGWSTSVPLPQRLRFSEPTTISPSAHLT